MRLSQLTQPIKEGNYPEPRKMQVTQADKEANTKAWKRFKAGDPRYEWHDSNLKEFGPDERYIKVGNTTGIANKKTGGIVAHTKIGNTKVSANNHMNADGTQGNINATGKIAGVKVKASNNLKGTNPKLKYAEGYNDDEWSDKEKENLEYTVWVGGTEVNDNWLTYDEAKVLYDKFKAQGYDDIQLDARIKQDIPTDSKLISKEFHGIDWDKINEESEEEKYEKLEVAYGHGGEAGLAKALGMTEPQLNDIIDELAAESHEWARQVLTADDDRDVIIDRIMDLAADGRYDDYHTSKWDEAYNPETGRDPNVDTTEWDNLIAKAKKKQGISDEEEVWFNYEDIGGNIIVNPKSTIEDQIAELLNRYYDISPMEFDPSKIEITTPDQTNQDASFAKTQNAEDEEEQHRRDVKHGLYGDEEWAESLEEESLNASHESLASSLIASRQAKREEVKAVREDEEAIAARDEFLKVMDMKPKSSNKAIDTIKKIVADKQNQQVKFDDGKMKVDLYTASAVSAVYDALKPETQEKVDNMLRTKEGMIKLSNFAFTKLNEEIQMVNEAEKEGRLDEILPLVPIGAAAARVLVPMAWRWGAKKLAQRAGKKLATKAGGKFKPGMNPNSVASRIKPGGGKSVYKQIKDKSIDYGLKPSAYVGTADYMSGGSGSGTTLANKAWDAVDGNRNSNSNSKSKSSNSTSDALDVVKRNWGIADSAHSKGKLIPEEYSGADAVIDKNGKKHDPKSTSGKMIINMKCNNPNVKDKTGCGKGKLGKEEKKRRRGVIVKKGWDMAKTGGKKLGKSIAGTVTSTGFANPFDLKSSKYSPEDKAIEMMREATEQAMIELKMPPIDNVEKTKVTVKGPQDNYDDRVQRLARIKDTGKMTSPKSNINIVDKNKPWYNQGAFKKNPDNFKGYPDKWKTKKVDTKVDKKDDRAWNKLKVNF